MSTSVAIIESVSEGLRFQDTPDSPRPDPIEFDLKFVFQKPRDDDTNSIDIAIFGSAATETQKNRPPSIVFEHQVEKASTIEELIALLQLFGLRSLVDRLQYLAAATSEDDEQTPIKIRSLEQFVKFLINERGLGDPEIGLSEDGAIQADWRLGESGILAVRFPGTQTAKFAAISCPFQAGLERQTLSGILRSDKIVNAIEQVRSAATD